ncbi:DUF1003 domain-containing protein [Teichococcus oryzae]|uniref:DUF1003 domain-containing protein n=1 Tax=Teichococcus oryzae TaxID=1608942 RepID=A0A5B2TL78_9PROT|nr:DUF1003 domain-containing protein [Pseudoroseomonas oryzae]KAA2214949.1 DUF1003 domain-containing protein [Pseudoroseomonas oryzae]
MSKALHPDYDAAAQWFGEEVRLGEPERRALTRALQRRPLSQDTNEAFADKLSFGDRLADQVAAFGGSWGFIIISVLVLAGWALANTALLTRPFDPYPFIFLNLLLSMVAALQAPVIMMSQNRQSARDRLVAAHDYEVNLKAEIEIMALHDKFDRMRAEQLRSLVEQQQEQITLLANLLEEIRARGKP